MPQIVPVSDFRSDVTSVSRYTDEGEVVVLTQNGRPRWAMVDYSEWNEAARAQERSYARALLEAERLEDAGAVSYMDAEGFERHQDERIRALLGDAVA